MEQRRIFNPTGACSATALSALRRTPQALMLAIITFALTPFIGDAHATKLVGHRAHYSLGPGHFSNGGDFTGVSGNMELSLEVDCNGWVMSQTLQMNLQLANGNEVRQFHRYSGRESEDGTRYDFSSSSQMGGVLEEFRGRAIMDPAGSSGSVGAGNAVFRIPEGQKIPLPNNTRFPLGHTRYLIDRASAGDRLAAATVFDGADDGGAQEVSAFIGRKQLARDVIGKDVVLALGPLADGSGWKIRMAFYKLDSQQAIPEYEVEALQLENGVAPWLLLDYHDFSVVLKMNKLEEILPPKC